MSTSLYGTDWSNIDLNSEYEKSLSIVDSYTFNDLLMEVHCNIENITEETIMRQFEEALQSRIHSAREVMRENINNITKYAVDYRNEE